MIRIEGIPEIACRLRREAGLRIAAPNVRWTSRIVAIGKALIAVKTHYRRRRGCCIAVKAAQTWNSEWMSHAKAEPPDEHILHGLHLRSTRV